MGFYDSLRTGFQGLFGKKTTSDNFLNPFNEAFNWAVNGGYAAYEPMQRTYVKEGYNVNSMVYSMVNAMSQKTASVPIYVKEIEDEQEMTKLLRLRSATGGNGTIEQKMREIALEIKAFKDGDKPFPMEKPNPNQTWQEWIALYKTFLKVTGNAYIYLLSVKEGPDAGKPMACYLLPSHNVQLIIKENTALLGIEDPVQGYLMVQGRARSYMNFSSEEVIHIKYANPNYGQNGEHLYGQSPLRSALKNIESSNSAMNLNIKTLKSGGAFGFIHGKGPAGITVAQAKELKERLLEMDKSPENLSKIAGVSAELGFQRISLTSEELRPFDYLDFDEKQIADVLAWPLDDSNRGDFGGTIAELRKMRVTDNIVPDLNLLMLALNEKFLPRFPGYEGCRLEYDIMEMPEMQDDASKLSAWLYQGLDKGVFTRDEIRKALRWPETGEQAMQVYTVTSDIITLEEAIDNDFNVDEDEQV